MAIRIHRLDNTLYLVFVVRKTILTTFVHVDHHFLFLPGWVYHVPQPYPNVFEERLSLLLSSVLLQLFLHVQVDCGTTKCKQTIVQLRHANLNALRDAR